jgi:hypothetical protein
MAALSTGMPASMALLLHAALDKFSDCAIKFLRMFVGKLAGLAASTESAIPLVAILAL